MKHQKILVAALASFAMAGCNLFAYDNFDPPTSVLTGTVVFNGAPVTMRGHVHNLAIWQLEPVYDLAATTSMAVRINQDGTFRGLLYNGTYEASLESSTGPWVPQTTRHQFVMNGSASFDFPVQLYYTIVNPTITYTQPTTANPGGTITATFTVGRHNTTRGVTNVGLYIGLTNTVDITNSLQIGNAVRQRTGASIATQLNSDSPITISIPLPANIHLTPSPDRRNNVWVRVGIQPAGITEHMYSPVTKIDI
jgi:hypothetical protein